MYFKKWSHSFPKGFHRVFICGGQKILLLLPQGKNVETNTTLKAARNLSSVTKIDTMQPFYNTSRYFTDLDRTRFCYGSQYSLPCNFYKEIIGK